MKKVKLLIVSLIAIFAFNINVNAASGSLSVSSSNVYVGNTFTVTANVNSAAAWNIHVSASGPVSGCTINQADATADAMDTNKSFRATCTATGTGTITVTLTGDVTSASDGNAVIVSGSRNITVSQKPAAPSNNNNNNNNTNNNNNNNNNYNNNNNNNQETDKKSKNNSIKELSVEGHKLNKVNNNSYTLSVPNDVNTINIKATAEDSKAKVTGAGKHDIKVGDNNIEIIVTAENGSQNKINIKVTRKDGYYLEDLDSVLKNNKIDDINIIIKSDTKITSSDLEKIKESGKTVKLNYYNKDKKLEYSWIIDGEKLKNTNDLTTTILNDSENKKDILKLSNYADGLFISLKQTSNLPTGTKIKIFVGNKYEDNDLVNVYTYTNDKEKLDLVANKIKVEDGYIEFSIIESSDYFITMSTISNSDNVVVTTEKEKSSPILTIILSIIILILIGIIVAFILKNKKNNKEDEIYDDETPITSNQEITSSITTTEPSINATSSEAVLNPELSNNTTSSTINLNPEPSINTTSSTPTINPEPSINTTSSEAVLNPEPSNNIQTNINNTGNIENNDDIL